MNTRARRSQLRQPSTAPLNLRQRLHRVQNEVHRALAVMDKTTGKLLNYRQLIRHPAYHADWTLSSANEFGRLANGVGGRIKNPTNTIKFIPKSAIPRDRLSFAQYDQKRKSQTELALLLVVTELTTRAKSRLQQRICWSPKYYSTV
jgi:hypothetical protein